MLESLTIFDKGGLILYQHVGDSPSTISSSTSSSQSAANNGDNSEEQKRQQQADIVDRWMEEVYFNPTRSQTERYSTIKIGNAKIVVEWEESADFLCVAIYPDITAFPWIRPLLQATVAEYQIFAHSQLRNDGEDGENKNDLNAHLFLAMTTSQHHGKLFDKTFQVLLRTHKASGKGSNPLGPSSSRANNGSNAKQTGKSARVVPKPGKGGKEKRHWHDGKAKVTKEAMASLDFSNPAESTEDAQQQAEDRALSEARAAYLPTDADLDDFNAQVSIDDNADEDSDQGWGSSLSSLFQQMTGQKVLAAQDLEAPLKEMHKLLTSKNVAADIAQQICTKVEAQLVGKKLNSMYRVKTAVRQALESVINKLLAPSAELDVVRRVVSKRDAIFGNKRPYVICVVGINGVGKSTSLAKIAYHLKTHGGCNPLLAACDTFRSGAVEQLGMHAKCLDVPIFSKGYSKDPSNVAKAAIEQAIQDKNDVVLVDTAGRMQNNVPLMKALGKLVMENKPDLTVFVGEALVGNDGVDQVRMFNQAVSTYGRNHKIDAILLTKFDTVSDKVGAALSMTHVTNAPILFVGTGQKYHHLQKLSTQSVIQSLFR